LDWLSKNQDWIFPELSDIAKIILTTKGIISSDYNYGLRLFSFSNQINQIDDYVIAQLKKDPLSRRAVCMLFNPLIDQKKVRGEIPCILSISFLLRNGKLHATAVIRSSDIFLGLPANLYQLFVISDYVAQKLGVQVGELTTISHSAHLYGDYQEQINKLLTQYAYK
jgi:thymidylate synthase